jgi:hypothetical protein
VLQTADRLAERGLGDTQLCRRAREASGPRDCQNGNQIIKGLAQNS